MIKYGLDFGTTNSSISLSKEGNPTLLPIDYKSQNPEIIRSLLYFFHRELVFKKDKYGNQTSSYVGDFRYTFGQEALESYLQDNRNRKPGVVRQIFTGKMVQTNISPNAPNADLVAEYFEEIDYGTGRLLQALKTALKSPIYKGTNIFGRFFTLEQMIGIFVSLIKHRADGQIDIKADSLRVGRPVHFLDDPEKDQEVEDRLRESLKMVGFRNIEFEYEPIAAAKYFLWKYPQIGKKILVFDFGGGTLDLAVVEMGEKIKVHATDGVYIGGNLLNADIMQAKLLNYFGSDILWGERKLAMPSQFIDALSSWYSIPNLNSPDNMKFLYSIEKDNTDPQALKRLMHLIKMNLGFEVYEAIEVAKKELSQKETTHISYNNGPIDISIPITRQEFENLINPRVTAIRGVLIRCLESAHVNAEEIDIVVRTGGSSLIPMVEQMLADIFGRQKVQMFDPFTSIAAGLALP